MMDKTELREILLDEFDMQAAHIEETLKQVEGLKEGMKAVFFDYLRTKKVPDITVGEYSCQSLVEKQNLTIIGAILMLDWLEKDREAAETALMFL